MAVTLLVLFLHQGRQQRCAGGTQQHGAPLNGTHLGDVMANGLSCADLNLVSPSARVWGAHAGHSIPCTARNSHLTLMTLAHRCVQDEDWRPSITVNQILKGIQQLLDSPNEHSPAQADAYMYFTQRTEEYRKKVLAQARHYSIDRVNS